MLKPLGDRVIIQVQQQPQEESVGGIVIANNAKDKPQTGKVIAVGSGRVLDNGKKLDPSVQKGDNVLFDKYAGTSVKYEGESYLVVHDKDLVAIVD